MEEDPGRPKNEGVRVPIEPEIDLHPFRPADIPSVLEEYVQSAHDAGFRDVRIVHGRGRGIQRAIVQRLLDRNPLVEAFDDDRQAHLGATLVRLVR